ncbi:MAG TPA: flippase-like domain-containing protein [Chloroflexi bacterium]|nr:flippase-like domain-containing protein [Chloroflexota bacterium]
MKNRRSNLIKIAVTLGLLLVMVFTLDLSQVWGALASARWADLAIALLLYQVGIIVRAYRWQALLRAFGITASLPRLTRLYYVGMFFNSFLPSGFGGDVVRMVELSQDGADTSLAISTVLVDRIMGLLVLFVMALIALPFSWQLVPATVTLALLALIAGVALGIYLLLNRPLVEALARRLPPVGKLLARPTIAALYASFHRYDRPALVRAAAASLVFNLSLIVTQAYLGRAVGVHLSLGYFFLFVPILSSLLTLPISISGFGVREGGYVVLFGQAGVAAPQAVAMSLLFYAVNALTGLVGGVLYLVQSARGLRRRAAGSS